MQPKDLSGKDEPLISAEDWQNPQWYAIQTRSRHEKMVRDQLAAKNITHLLPLWRKRSQWKDRVKIIELPLFTGYLFGHFALQSRLEILNTVGVARLVSLNGKPEPIPEEQIAVVQKMITERLPYDPHPYLTTGMRVRVKRGVLAGTEGILVAKTRHQRLVISIDLIQKAVAVNIDSADIEPVY
jgi:transcription antitermination factor NusG